MFGFNNASRLVTGMARPLSRLSRLFVNRDYTGSAFPTPTYARALTILDGTWGKEDWKDGAKWNGVEDEARDEKGRWTRQLTQHMESLTKQYEGSLMHDALTSNPVSVRVVDTLREGRFGERRIQSGKTSLLIAKNNFVEGGSPALARDTLHHEIGHHVYDMHASFPGDRLHAEYHKLYDAHVAITRYPEHIRNRPDEYFAETLSRMIGKTGGAMPPQPVQDFFQRHVLNVPRKNNSVEDEARDDHGRWTKELGEAMEARYGTPAEGHREGYGFLRPDGLAHTIRYSGDAHPDAAENLWVDVAKKHGMTPPDKNALDALLKAGYIRIHGRGNYELGSKPTEAQLLAMKKSMQATKFINIDANFGNTSSDRYLQSGYQHWTADHGTPDEIVDKIRDHYASKPASEGQVHVYRSPFEAFRRHDNSLKTHGSGPAPLDPLQSTPVWVPGARTPLNKSVADLGGAGKDTLPAAKTNDNPNHDALGRFAHAQEVAKAAGATHERSGLTRDKSAHVHIFTADQTDSNDDAGRAAYAAHDHLRHTPGMVSGPFQGASGAWSVVHKHNGEVTHYVFRPPTPKTNVVWQAIADHLRENSNPNHDERGRFSDVDSTGHSVIKLRSDKPAHVVAAFDAMKRDLKAERIALSLYSVETEKGPATVEFRPTSEGIHLAFVGVGPQDRGKGIGSSIMQTLTRIADTHGVKLDLEVAPQGKGGLSKAQLHKWYKRFGFGKDPEGLLLDRDYLVRVPLAPKTNEAYEQIAKALHSIRP